MSHVFFLLAQTPASQMGKLQKDPMILIFGDWGDWNILHFFAFFALFVIFFTPWFNGYSVMGILNTFLMPSRLRRLFENIEDFYNK